MTVALSSCEILSLTNPNHCSRWSELVDRAPVPDVYYRPAYAGASGAAGDGKPVGLLLGAGNAQVLMPLLLRPLSSLPSTEDEYGFDAITPYGYGGLLPLCDCEPPAKEELSTLLDTLCHWCREAGVVSCLIRLHPLLRQAAWLGHEFWPQQGSSLLYRTPTTALDLTRWDSEHQRVAGLHKNRRVALNRARRDLRVMWSDIDLPMSDALALFRKIYEQRMNALTASPYYFFPGDYYSSLAEGLGDNLGVALAWREDELVGASLFLADRCFAHYHLSGSNQLGRELEAGTLLISAGAAWARGRGCLMLHLGGGLGDGDGLFDYKRSFGGAIYPYHTLQVVADQVRYRHLVEQRLKSDPLWRARAGFFPEYRA